MIHRWIADNQNPRSLASLMRRRRNRELVELIEQIGASTPVVYILDVGGSTDFWEQLLADNPPVSIENQSDAPTEIDVTLCNLDGRFGSDSDSYNTVTCDARSLLDYFGPRQFHLVVSNSLIEHVGDRLDQELAAGSIKSVGVRYWVQTPNWWFPIEPHWVFPFFHWLPERWRARLVQARAWGHMPQHTDHKAALESVRSVRLLDRSEMSDLFPRAEIAPERVGPFVKSWTAIGQAL